IRELMAARTEWKGTASQLLHALEEIAGERTVRSKGWPISAKSLGRGLRRPATFLRKIGIEIDRERDPHSKERTRTIIITRTPPLGKETSEMSNRPKDSKTNGLGPDNCSDNWGAGVEMSEERSEENADEINALDNSDNSDIKTHPLLDRGSGRICAQCNAGGEPLALVGGVYLHPECRRFWFQDHPEADGIPAALR